MVRKNSKFSSPGPISSCLSVHIIAKMCRFLTMARKMSFQFFARSCWREKIWLFKQRNSRETHHAPTYPTKKAVAFYESAWQNPALVSGDQFPEETTWLISEIVASKARRSQWEGQGVETQCQQQCLKLCQILQWSWVKWEFDRVANEGLNIISR